MKEERIFDVLENADDKEVELLAELPLLTEEEKKRMKKMSKNKLNQKFEESKMEDQVSGVERYDRRISINRMVSIAAVAVLCVGGVLGGVHFIKKGNFNNYHGSSEYATEVTDSSSETTTEISTEPVTTTVTTAMNVVEPVIVPVTAEPHDDVPEVITGEWLRERCLNATHYYDKFSADIHSFIAMYGYVLGDYEINGTVKIDNTAMNGEMYGEMSSAERETWDRTYNIFLNNIYVELNQNGIAALNQNDVGKFCAIKSVDKYYKNDSFKPDRPLLSGCLSFVGFENKKVREDGTEDIKNETPWTVTGERYENGRRIASVSFSYELLREGRYEPRYITADFDAETGVCVASETRTDDEYRGNGYLISSFKATNYKFDDEAEAPMTAAEVREYMESNGYEADPDLSDYQVENLG